MRATRLGLVAAALGLCAALGCVGGVSDTVPPTVSALRAAPASLPLEGGAVALSVTATDQGGVAGVEFRIVGPTGAEQLAATAGAAGAYTLSYDAPPNLGVTTQNYDVSALATDKAGNEGTAGPTRFTVAGPSAPPPPPVIP